MENNQDTSFIDELKTFEEYSSMADIINNMLGMNETKDEFLSKMGISITKKPDFNK